MDLRRRRYRKLLRAKLAEEVDEMLATDDADAPGELADVLEVVLDVARVLDLQRSRPLTMTGSPGTCGHNGQRSRVGQRPAPHGEGSWLPLKTCTLCQLT